MSPHRSPHHASGRALPVMVATVTAITSACVTVHYFEQDGYYSKNDPEHRRASFWHSAAARDLALGRHVKPKIFEVASRFDLRGRPPVPGLFGFGARASVRPTIHSMSSSVSVTPAAMAGAIQWVGAVRPHAERTPDAADRRMRWPGLLQCTNSSLADRSPGSHRASRVHQSQTRVLDARHVGGEDFPRCNPISAVVRLARMHAVESRRDPEQRHTCKAIQAQG